MMTTSENDASQTIYPLIVNFPVSPFRLNQEQLFTSKGIKNYGSIIFPNSKSNRSKFIRIMPEADVPFIKSLMQDDWFNERPSLVISITGGAKDYIMKPKLLSAFRRGLLKVAKTTNACIITGGMNTGIMKLVGDIIQLNADRSHRIRLVGIATWGCIAGLEQLEGHSEEFEYKKPQTSGKGEASLEPNHTHFIFVDDGTRKKYGGEITFRARLEAAISSRYFSPTNNPNRNSSNRLRTVSATSEVSESIDSTPVVLLVVEGGPNTIRTVHEAVVQNNIPAVFIEGTGRCCDLFAKAVRLYKDYRRTLEGSNEKISFDSNLSVQFEEEIKNKLRLALHDELNKFQDVGSKQSSSHEKRGNVQNNDSIDYFELIYECVESRGKFLNIVRLNSRSSGEPDIDLAILQALLNASSEFDSKTSDNLTKGKQLQLALEWNRVDMVKNHIMKSPADWQKVNTNKMFLVALKRNQIEFVKLFLDNDLSLTEAFRNDPNLENLYQETQDKYADLTRNSIQSSSDMYRQIIYPLLGDQFDLRKVVNSSKKIDLLTFPRTDRVDKFTRFTIAEIRSVVINSIKENSTSIVYSYRFDFSVNDSSKSCRHQSIYRARSTSEAHSESHDCCVDLDHQIFLWSVVTGHHELSFIFWSRSKNKIASALVGALIHRERFRRDQNQMFSQIAEQFEILAVEILNKFFDEDPSICSLAITRQIPSFGNITWLELAIESQSKHFIAQRAIQTVLNNIWYGDIDPHVNDRAIILSTLLIPYSGFLPSRNQTKKIDEEKKTSPEKSQRLFRKISAHQDVTKTTTNSVKLTMTSGNGTNRKSKNRSKKQNCVEYFRRIINFMYAPFVKYIYHLYSHVIFLLLFSYVILCEMYPIHEINSDYCGFVKDDDHLKDNSTTKSFDAFQVRRRISLSEMLLVIWISTLFCEEIRQLFSIEAHSIRMAIDVYFESFWNKLDALALILFYVGFGLRFVASTECFCFSRIFLSIDLTLWFIRSLDLFAAVKRLGPNLVMIESMINDLKFFMFMVIVFILGFGVSSRALVYGTTEFSWHLPREIINSVYWQMFGDLNTLDKFEENYKPAGYAVFLLTAVYMSIVSILLVNLLIAMFSNTFDRLQNDTDRIWKFQRYSLICEYLSRPTFPPPLIFLSHIGRLTAYLLLLFIKSEWFHDIYNRHTNRTKYKIKIESRLATEIETREDAIGDEVYFIHSSKNRKINNELDVNEENVECSQEFLSLRVRSIENRLQTMSVQQNLMFEHLDCLLEGLRKIGGEQIPLPDRRRFDAEDSFDDSIDTGLPKKRQIPRDSSVDEPAPSSKNENHLNRDS